MLDILIWYFIKPFLLVWFSLIFLLHCININYVLWLDDIPVNAQPRMQMNNIHTHKNQMHCIFIVVFEDIFAGNSARKCSMKRSFFFSGLAWQMSNTQYRLQPRKPSPKSCHCLHHPNPPLHETPSKVLDLGLDVETTWIVGVGYLAIWRR